MTKASKLEDHAGLSFPFCSGEGDEIPAGLWGQRQAEVPGPELVL